MIESYVIIRSNSCYHKWTWITTWMMAYLLFWRYRTLGHHGVSLILWCHGPIDTKPTTDKEYTCPQKKRSRIAQGNTENTSGWKSTQAELKQHRRIRAAISTNGAEPGRSNRTKPAENEQKKDGRDRTKPAGTEPNRRERKTPTKTEPQQDERTQMGANSSCQVGNKNNFQMRSKFHL